MYIKNHIIQSVCVSVCMCVCVCMCMCVCACVQNAFCLAWDLSDAHNGQEVSKKKKKSVQNVLYMGKAGTNRRYSHSCVVCLSSSSELSKIIVTVDILCK